MKLTEEGKQKVLSKRNELSKRVTTRGNQDTLDLVEWALSEFSQLPENTTQWIHCSERLPTKEDASNRGTLHTFCEKYGAHCSCWDQLRGEDNIWWTPIPKNLKKPSPPDPFEEWWENIQKFLEGELPKSDKEIARLAYEQGKLHPKPQQ